MKFAKRLLKWVLIILIVLSVAYLLGPKPSSPTYTNTLPSVPADAAALETYIKQNEAKHKIKPENEARIIWANDSAKQNMLLFTCMVFLLRRKKVIPYILKLPKSSAAIYIWQDLLNMELILPKNS